MRAAANSCVYVRTRTVPARCSAALNTVSGIGAMSSSPSGSRIASSDRPAFSTTTGLMRAAARNADMNARASPTDST